MDTDQLAEFLAFARPAESTRRVWVRQIVRRLHEVGVPIDTPAPPAPDTVWRTPDRDWDTLEGALRRLNPPGNLDWLACLRARRDSMVLLCAATGLTRRRMLHLTYLDLTPPHPSGRDTLEVGPVARRATDGSWLLCGTPLPVADDPAGCGTCALTRWLRVLDANARIGRAGTQQVWRTPLPEHDHTHPLPDTWPAGTWLRGMEGETVSRMLPRIITSGVFEANLSPGMVSRIVAQRQARAWRLPDAVFLPEPVPASAAYLHMDWDDLDALVDRVCADADQLIARVHASIDPS